MKIPSLGNLACFTFFGYDVGVPRSLRTRHIQFGMFFLSLCIFSSPEPKAPVSGVPTSSGNHGKPGKSLKKFHAWKNHEI